MVVFSLGLAQAAFAGTSTAWTDVTAGKLSYSGNVGIGTTSPGTILNVAGNLTMSGSNPVIITIPNDTGIISTLPRITTPSGSTIIEFVPGANSVSGIGFSQARDPDNTARSDYYVSSKGEK